MHRFIQHAAVLLADDAAVADHYTIVYVHFIAYIGSPADNAPDGWPRRLPCAARHLITPSRAAPPLMTLWSPMTSGPVRADVLPDPAVIAQQDRRFQRRRLGSGIRVPLPTRFPASVPSREFSP